MQEVLDAIYRPYLFLKRKNGKPRVPRVLKAGQELPLNGRQRQKLCYARKHGVVLDTPEQIREYLKMVDSGRAKEWKKRAPGGGRKKKVNVEGGGCGEAE